MATRPRQPNRTETAAGASLRVTLSPHGTVHLEPDPSGEVAVAPDIVRALGEAFARGAGHGLLLLGAGRMPDELPATLAFWRRLGHAYVARACASDGAAIAPPAAELEALVREAPAMVGGEYLSAAVLARLWAELEAAFVAESAGDVPALLARLNPAWHLVGRVCFHLAENKRNERAPFAFLATYASRIGRGAKVQHQPLGAALREYQRDAQKLVALLEPVQRAAERSALVAELVASKKIFQPQAWSPAQAYRLLQDVPLLEEAGVVVRVPDWWSPDARRRARVSATVTVGARDAGLLGVDTMLDFAVDLALDGETLSKAEWRRIAGATAGLALIKGRWVEVDGEQLAQALAHWRAVEEQVKREGLTFAEGMRLLAGVRLGGPEMAELDDAELRWTEVVADRRLGELLAQVRDPALAEPAHPGAALRAALRPYQEVGLAWLWLLWRLGLGACLADDMGLGKTLQVIALLLRIGQVESRPGASLVVVPASLVANWQAELARFAPSLNVLVAHPSAMPSAEIGKLTAKRIHEHAVVITSYGTLLRHDWPKAVDWRVVVLDEAQAIKNPDTRQARAAKALPGKARIALTGTPVENRLGDLWSLFDFLNPGLLGGARQFDGYVKRLAKANGGYAPLRELVRPYVLRRLKSDKRVIADLPDKTEVRAFCTLSKKQAVLYQQSVDALREQLARERLDGVERRGLVLAFLLRFKQICNHPSQWLGDGGWAAADSGKLARLGELCEEIVSRQEKVLVFTQFRQVIEPLTEFLENTFGRAGLALHGATAVKKRQKLVEEFARDDGPPFFVLSLKAGGTGLNLTAASHVIHFDRWWNPAVENQATDRAYRIGQHRNVLVHKFVCRGTVEERIDELIASKVALSEEILGGGDEVALTELSNEELIELVSLDIHAAVGE